MNCISDSADSSADHERAVPLRAHLREAARFVFGRHQQKIRARDETMLDFVSEHELRAHVSGARSLEFAEDRLVAVFALAEENPLSVEQRGLLRLRG